MHASRGVVVNQADACWGCVASAHGVYVGIACVGLPAKTHCSAGFDSHERFLDVLEQVNDSYRGTLSSYCYVLMCIHLLQQRQPPILPCLHSIKPPTLFRCAPALACPSPPLLAMRASWASAPASASSWVCGCMSPQLKNAEVMSVRRLQQLGCLSRSRNNTFGSRRVEQHGGCSVAPCVDCVVLPESMVRCCLSVRRCCLC